MMTHTNRMFTRRLMAASAVLAVLVLLLARATAAELIMLEQRGCEWCEVWDREIAPVYPKTAEGKAAPLRRVDIHAALPDDLLDIMPGRFTPTFILWDDGKEIGRITGYPGEDFFWGLLEQLVEKLPESPAENAS